MGISFLPCPWHLVLRNDQSKSARATPSILEVIVLLAGTFMHVHFGMSRCQSGARTEKNIDKQNMT